MTTRPSLWQLNRHECVAGRPLWDECPLCADRTSLDDYCRFCDGRVEHAYYASGGIHDWQRYRSKSLDTLDWRWLGDEVATALQAYVNHLPEHIRQGRGLLLMGGVGSGKTHIGVGLGLLALALGYSAYATTFGELLLAIRSSFDSPSGRSEADLMETVCGVDLLLLDDLGMEKPSAWAIDRLAYLVNERYSQQHATIVTSNFHPARLAHQWGERVVSRLLGTCTLLSVAHVADYRPVEQQGAGGRQQATEDEASHWPGTEATVMVSNNGRQKPPEGTRNGAHPT